MIEQYVYNRITQDSTMQNLLDDGDGGMNIFPSIVPSGIDVDPAMTFSVITTNDAYPTIESRNVQFNIFAKTHTKTVEICEALADLFNEDNNQKSGDTAVVYSERSSESDLDYDYDDGIYQREATYYFKIR